MELPLGPALWECVFTVAPLVLVGTKEADGWDFAPKHMAMPLGWEGFYCFACTPEHATYRNVQAHPQFTVSFPQPDQILSRASPRAAAPRATRSRRWPPCRRPRPGSSTAESSRAALLYLECELERIVDGFGPNSLIVGRVVAAAAAREALRGAEVDDADLVHRLGLLAYLAPGRFAVVRDSLAFPFPADFRR